MYRKAFLLISFLVVLCIVGSASAETIKWTGAVDTDWFNIDNWDLGRVPVCDPILGDVVHINGGVPNFPVISSAGAACNKLWLGAAAGTGDAYLTMEAGGELTVSSGETATENQTVCLGQKAGTHGIVTMNGGQINMTIGEECEIGGRAAAGQGTYNIYGGIHSGGDISVPGCNHNGTVNIYSGALTSDYVGFRSGGYCNLYGGVIDCNNWLMWNDYGGLDIYEGIWITRTQVSPSMTYHGRYYATNANNAGDMMVRAYGGRGPVAVEWTNMTHTDPNLVIAESELAGLIPVPDPNGEIYWWARADWDPNTAALPEPVDGFGAADPDQELSWAPAYTGNATHHDIYFGTSFDDVNDANVADPCGVYYTRQTVDQNSIARAVYHTSGPLTMGQDYYWRIDEVNEADEPDSIWKGPVWSFSISYTILDDFEDYPGTPELRLAWPGTPVGYTAVYLEGTVVLGEKSMWLPAVTHIPLSPYPMQIETRRTFAGEQKWDPANTDARLLAFSVHGHPDNADNAPIVDIYVKLKDSVGNEAIQYVGDTSLVQKEEWTEVFFDLDAFTSPAVVDLSKVTELAIGVENSTETLKFTHLYVDDIRLYLAGCHPDYLWSNTDLNRDCITNISDVDILVRTGNWLMSNWDVTPVAPSVGPVLKYEFDGDATDSSGNGYDATIYDNDGIEWAEGHLGENPGALVFDGVATHVNDIPLAALSTVSDEVTVSFWMYGNTETGSRTLFDGSKAGLQYDDRVLMLMITSTAQASIGSDDANSIDGISSGTLQSTDMIGRWNHYAVVKDCDANQMAIYVNGELVGNEKYPGRRSFGVRDNLIENIDKMVIGTNVRVEDQFSGMIDDFRIYDYAMTQEQVASLAGKTEVFTQPLERLLQTGYNYNPDVVDDGMIDFKDYARVAEMWLVQLLFGNY